MRSLMVAALVALVTLAGCRAPHVVTSPSRAGCPAGFAWIYHDQLADRDVCVRRDTARTAGQ